MLLFNPKKGRSTGVKFIIFGLRVDGEQWVHNAHVYRLLCYRISATQTQVWQQKPLPWNMEW